jgi:hypothetical protein
VDAPKVGTQVEFTPLPPAPGRKLKRATEVSILPSASVRRTPGEIVVVRTADGLTRITLRRKTRGGFRDTLLDELRIQ